MSEQTEEGESAETAGRFEGEFKPPRMGNRHMPIRVGGPGLVELGETRLVVKGYDAQGSCLLPMLLFFAGFAGTVAVAAWLEVSGMVVNVGFGGLVAAFFSYALARRGDYEQNDPRQLEIPWDKIESVDWSGDDSGMQSDAGEVKILVDDHDPEGMLHFFPNGDPREFAAAVRQAAGLEAETE